MKVLRTKIFFNAAGYAKKYGPEALEEMIQNRKKAAYALRSARRLTEEDVKFLSKFKDSKFLPKKEDVEKMIAKSKEDGAKRSAAILENHKNRLKKLENEKHTNNLYHRLLVSSYH